MPKLGPRLLGSGVGFLAPGLGLLAPGFGMMAKKTEDLNKDF